MKKILFVMQHPPYHGIRLQEKLDLILTAAAFDQAISLLFVDDGVYQILSGQQPEGLDLKNTASVMRALEMYDVNDIRVETEALTERGLTISDLILPVAGILRQETGDYLQSFDLVLND